MKAHDAKTFLRAAVLLAVAVTGGNIPAQAQTLTTIHSFTGANGDGEYPFPEGRLPFDNNGALYGTTAGGGTNYNGTYIYSRRPQYRAVPGPRTSSTALPVPLTDANPAWAWSLTS